MKNSFWKSRMALVLLGVVLGLLARTMLGAPEPDLPPKPRFSHPLPEEVPLALPLIEVQ